MSHGASAAAINEDVRAIMIAKPLDTLTGHPNTENVDHLEEKMAKNCAYVRTTVWGGQYGCLASALSKNNLYTITKGTVLDSALCKLDKINAANRENTSNFDQIALKADQDKLWTEW